MKPSTTVSLPSSSSDDSSLSSSSTQPSNASHLSPTSTIASSPPSPSYDNQTTPNRPKFQASFSSPPSSLPCMPPLPDLVARTPRRSSSASTASSTSSSSFASYLPQHHPNPPPLPPIPAIYSNPSLKPRPEDFRPKVQEVKQLGDKRARTRALLAAQSSSKKAELPQRRSTAPLSSRIASEGSADTSREGATPERRGPGDRSSSFGALEDARKNLARRSGIPLLMTSRPPSSVFLLEPSNTKNRSSFVQDFSTSPLDSSSSLPPPPPPQAPNLPSPLDASCRFHPQRSQFTPSVARDSSPSPSSRASLHERARTVSFAESPVHVIDDDPFLERSSEEEEVKGGLEGKMRRKRGGIKLRKGGKKSWWSKGKERVQSIFTPRALPTPPPLDSIPTLDTKTLEDPKPLTPPPPSSSNPTKTNAFQRFFRPPTLAYATGLKFSGSAPDLGTTLFGKNDSSSSLREVPPTEERRKSVFDPSRAGERGAVPGGGGGGRGAGGARAVQLTEAQLHRKLGRMEDQEERRVAESLFL